MENEEIVTQTPSLIPTKTPTKIVEQEQEQKAKEEIQYIKTEDDVLSQTPINHVDGIIYVTNKEGNTSRPTMYHVNTALGIYFPINSFVQPMSKSYLEINYDEETRKTIYCPYFLGKDGFCVVWIRDYSDGIEYVDGDLVDFLGENANYHKIIVNGVELGCVEENGYPIYMRQYGNYVMHMMVYSPNQVNIDNFLDSIVWVEPNLDYFQYLNIDKANYIFGN